jgi:hypothetical protein
MRNTNTGKSTVGALSVSAKVTLVCAALVIALLIVFTFKPPLNPHTALDLSEVPGSLLFTFYNDETETHDIWRINIADGEKEIFLPEYEGFVDVHSMRLDNFYYIPDERTLIEFRSEDTEGLFRVFARDDGSAELREKTVFDYPFVDVGMRYVEQIRRLCIWHRDGLDLLDMETGAVEKRLLKGEDIYCADWNEDFSEMFVSKRDGLWAFALDENRSRKLWDDNTYRFCLTADYDEIVYSNFEYIEKLNIENGSSRLLSRFDERVGIMAVSPDREYLAVYCSVPLFFGYGKGFVMIVRIRTGSKTLLYEHPFTDSINAMQWIDE